MKQYCETTNIVLAATLRLKGYQLDRIEKTGRRGVFCFANVTGSDLSDFDLGNMRVEPTALHNAVKALTLATKRIF